MPLSPLQTKIFRWCTAILLLAALGYAGMTVAAWAFVKYRRGVEMVAYADIALPWRWPDYQTKRGEHAIGLAFALLERGKFDQGLHHLRVGLARAPAHRDGRLLLAQIMAHNRRNDLARGILIDGLKFHRADPDYVGPVLEFLLARQADEEVMTLGNQILANRDGSPAMREIAALNAARAAYYRGRYEQADAYLRQAGLTANPNATLLIARMDWERGYRELALLTLRELHRQHPENEAVYVQLGELLRDAGLPDEARRVTVLHLVAHPECPRAAIARLLDLQKQNREEELQIATRDTLRTFADDPAGLLALGDFAATTGRVDLAREVLTAARDHRQTDETPMQLMLVESMLVATRHAEALASVQLLLKQPGVGQPLANVAQGLLALAHYGLGDPVSGQSALMSLMVQPDLRAESLLAVANRLVTMDQKTPARELLARAVTVDPQNQAALVRLIELDLDAENVAALPESLRRLLTLRKPPGHVLDTAHRLLRQDRFLFLPGRSALLDELSRARARSGPLATAG